MLFVVTRDGFDDISMAAWPSYNLTTIRQPVVPMMDESVEVLLRRVGDPEAPFVNRLIPGDLVVRGSARLPKGVSSGWVITKDSTKCTLFEYQGRSIQVCTASRCSR